MSHFLFNLEIHIRIMLILALILVFIYEAINGFHDTANSVVTVIYTCALRSHSAVLMSGIFNFLGVILSGLSVAYTIIHLLPTYFFTNTNPNHILAMIFSMLFAAILWNLGTWYLRLPTSSSHTLIGTLIGIGLVHAIITDCPMMQGLNIPQLINIFLSLIISPIIGVTLARIMMLILCRYWNNGKKHKDIHITPTQQTEEYGRSQPSLWTRVVLILSAAGVSFSHGANDGQKGIGLIMLLLIGVAPASFMLNMNASSYDISRTRNAVNNFYEYYTQHYNNFKTIVPSEITSIPISIALNQLKVIVPSITDTTQTFIKNNNITYFNQYLSSPDTEIQVKKIFHDLSLTLTIIHNASLLLENLDNYAELNIEQRSQMRQLLIYIVDILDQIVALPETSHNNRNFLNHLKEHLLNTIEYAPTWIILAVALSLSLGTIIGWKRVAITIGEKIGKKEMTYAQGLSAQLTTAISIGTASYAGMPVSTTHVLSSSITGSMLMRGWGVQRKTIKNILITWSLTLPVSIILSGSFYWITLKLLHKYIQI
ncbi:inorganic phosphate transporter [Candidatus Blochmannia vicinus (nom. nud.)]|uniref:Phosphate transporter n=1 Tax=Candidatus Blochmannia vicinus (nom. nud.) TaxID=251540 RepID=A0A9Q8TWU0_9ENTR|nr:inorganic phosphate transporter [Candidatus Blochmannia vicinus]URJ28140.1 inorganic phosphate transporter [Candidatus Blochmannia vicinus]URJ30585.1 inorganic phosphate transporter [Candidatus Blochmannia vicinus]